MKPAAIILLSVFFMNPPAAAMGRAKEPAPSEMQVTGPELKKAPAAPDSEPAPVNRPAAEPLPMPVYVSALPDLTDYNIFANSGWDGNWYVGYDVCWIKLMPKIPRGKYARAQIGVKIGRTKTQSVPGKPSWEKEPIDGKIYVAISGEPAWKSDSRHFLTAAEDIPLESDFENAQEDTGEARWFWVEVPLEQVNMRGKNYVALWSGTDFFVSRTSAPILCGGWGIKGQESYTWLNDEIHGAPPIDASTSLMKRISVFEPAIVLKLVPEGAFQEIPVRIDSIRENPRIPESKVLTVSAGGSQIERSWAEYFDTESGEWIKITRYLYDPPYMFTISPSMLPEGRTQVRVACEDIWINRGYSTPLEMLVQPSRPALLPGEQ